jgi:fatty acid desaturase
MAGGLDHVNVLTRVLGVAGQPAAVAFELAVACSAATVAVAAVVVVVVGAVVVVVVGAVVVVVVGAVVVVVVFFAAAGFGELPLVA